ncbi:perlucin-like protein [Crassostrea angulata]|uniref:perlucin-like protein n=1 Tax=Magallana angulata TaxID=2784310 RepID=UPI0022B0A885|nr:perlucin-like protein [Crassostrea angulata]
MFTFKTVFVFCVFCILVQICRSALRTLQVEQIFYNKFVLDNLLTEYGHASSALCSVVCQQEKCECFGFNSATQMCRVHTFCRPANTLAEESGWKYYRSRSEWITFMNSEYLLGLKAQTWNNSQLNCSVKGAKLVEIESPEEDTYIRTLANNLTESVWLGGTDLAEEGKWVWQSTSTLFSFSAWPTRQPNNLDNNQHCLSLYLPNGLTWNDRECSLQYQYICERELFTY